MEIHSFLNKLDFPVGPIEVQEPNQVCWNNNDWPVYLKCPFDIEIHKIIQIIRYGWKITKPQIIISVISDFNPLNTWSIDENIKNQLVSGLGKSASSSKMWIITNGIDVGSSRLISTVVNNLKCWEKAVNHGKPFEPLTAFQTICLGIVREDRLTSDPIMQKHLRNIQHLSNKIKNKKLEKFFIDDLHSHFIFLKSKKEDLELEQLLTLELMYQLSFETSWIDRDDKDATYQIKYRNFSNSFLNRIPFVAILIQGDQTSSIVVNEYLIKQIPIVVLEGSGGFADLLYFAYNEIKHIVYDDYCDEIDNVSFLNNQFSFIFKNKILNLFPDLLNKDDEINLLRENLIDCVRYSIQDGIEYLTFINVRNDLEENNVLSKLNEYLLNAFIKSTKIYELDNFNLSNKDINNEELLNKNLILTLDWNCPLIAKEQIVKKLLTSNVKINKSLFKRALIEKNREPFIEIFMQAGFQTRQLYNLNTIKWFIENALKKEFFLVVCFERILNLPLHNLQQFPSSKNFLKKLNFLIYTTTSIKNFFNETCFDHQNQIPDCIENSMIVFICIWSVFTLNIEIIKQIWPFYFQPIHLLLIVCNILKNLNNYNNDLAITEQINLYVNEFECIAISLLEEAFLNAKFRVFETLDLKEIHNHQFLACDIAANSMVYNFIAHQHTQKWLTNIFSNGIYIKQSGKLGFLDYLIPDGIKIISCVLFLFPINFWLHFSPVSKRKNLVLDEKKENIFLFIKTLFIKWINLMNAPITKFWTSLIFFSIFLIIFTYSITLPSCGNKKIDLIIFIWYNLIIIEDIKISYLILKKHLSMNIFYKYIELPFTLLFLITLYLGRIIEYEPFAKDNQYLIKMLMCAFLLQNYFQFVAIYLPINATLGPLFYYLKKMSLHDSFFFFLLCMPIIIGCGLAIQVSLYPDKIFDLTAIKTIFYRTFLNIFITLDDEYLYKENCLNEVNIKNNQCRQSYTNNPECPNIGLASYLFAFIFFLLLKLILMNILGAMFNASLVNINTQTVWRYQRFNLIMFFTLTSPFPPPLNLIYYFFYINKFIIKLLIKLIYHNHVQKLNSKFCSYCNQNCKHFWARISSKTKKKLNLIKNETEKTNLNNQIKINDLTQNLNEIKKVLFQLDYSNADLNDKEIIDKLKWIIKK